ncbi:glycosyl transferase [Gemmatimonadetes bacterium T265]|nr:glycosyl transferase [Gemmatimonadetes bacterium T265]
MRLVVFGLTVSSSWGNGHATLWRALIHALARQGHAVTFFERDVSYYAAHRDVTELPAGELVLYASWEDVRDRARRALADADVAMTTSYCPDAVDAAAVMVEARDAGGPLATFYDLDTPVTFARLDAGEVVPYLPAEGLGAFDLVLSYTGGRALDALGTRLGARRVAPLYGSVDPAVHRPAAPRADWRSDLSYIGTYAADRQGAVDALFLEPARRRPGAKFVLAGSQYPADFAWTPNTWYLAHLPPADHPAFYASSRLTLNTTRGAMAAMGWCPSGRLFEAAACGVPILTDTWDGLDAFFSPGDEILVAGSAEDALAALDRPDAELRAIADRARARTLEEHTADRRARELVAALEGTAADAARRTAPAAALAAVEG